MKLVAVPVVSTTLPPRPPEVASDAQAPAALPAPTLCALSECGPVRPHNGDQFLIAELDRAMRVQQSSVSATERSVIHQQQQGWLLAVADGLGEGGGGEMASHLTVRAVADYAISAMPWSLANLDVSAPLLAAGFQDTVRRCQREIAHLSGAADAARRAVMTLTLGYIVWPELYIVHVGDCRCYILRDGTLHRLTRDHARPSGHQPLLRGQDTAAPSHTLINAVGGSTDALYTELRHTTMRAGDVMFLCTDGISNALSDALIAQHLGALARDPAASADACLRAMFAAVVGRGGADNMTAIVGRF
ncbi:MAG: protein phosphatase 2C domain-containing protein [Haliangiales bacterium]